MNQNKDNMWDWRKYSKKYFKERKRLKVLIKEFPCEIFHEIIAFTSDSIPLMNIILLNKRIYNMFTSSNGYSLNNKRVSVWIDANQMKNTFITKVISNIVVEQCWNFNGKDEILKFNEIRSWFPNLKHLYFRCITCKKLIDYNQMRCSGTQCIFCGSEPRFYL